MGTITSIKKWNLENNCWTNATNDNEKKKSLSIASYGTIIHDETAPINLIIIADGCRVENHSKDGNTIDVRKARISNVIKYFENKKLNYKIELLLVDNDAPLVEQSKLIAAHIDSLHSFANYSTINFVGFSKCGCIGLDLIKYLKHPMNSEKTRIYSVSSTYLGTLIASPKILEIKARQIIERRFGKNALSDKITESLMNMYYSVFSNSHMDLDIAIKNGVPDKLLPYYDPSFLDNIFSKQNINSINLIKSYQNICTRINNETIKHVLESGNLAGLALLVMNECFYDGNSDGIVPYTSQICIDRELSKYNMSSITIPSTHNTLFMPYYTNELIGIINDNIENTSITMKKL